MKSKEIYRLLTPSEKEELISNGCTCPDWTRIKVRDGFNASSCSNVIFSGDIKLGIFRKQITDKSGVLFSAGISNARIHNCTIGSDVIINNIGDYISNYIIDDNVVIRNCGSIFCEGNSSFGNGVSVSVINETGSRSVNIWNGLSAHEAYVVSLYRHRTKAVENIANLVKSFASENSSDHGTIREGSEIINCGMIRNVNFGSYSHAEGALKLYEGSVNSTFSDPVYIGPGVIMNNFIVNSGSIINNSALIEKCFIGQGCIIDKHFSAENSLFFANCEGSNGEACSVFGGPYTVTHHKSTLLIAGLFSFMNAGSGSNQSNHMYKLGPVHQGIMERGCKTGSDSYLLWPSRIGAFTTVVGRHKKPLDTSLLPFSCLIESNNESILVPAINLRSIGTFRDAEKWPLRDRRKDSQTIDQIDFSLLNPYIAGKIMKGIKLLSKIKSESPENSTHIYNGVKITGSALDKGIDLYRAALSIFLGEMIVARLKGVEIMTFQELRKKLTPDGYKGKGEWVDIAGLIAPCTEIERLLESIETGQIQSIEKLSGDFVRIHNSCKSFEWTWACQMIEEETGTAVNLLTTEAVIGIIQNLIKSLSELDNQRYDDAEKEFSSVSMNGFGIDGDDSVMKLDFENVRGDLDSNKFVTSLRKDTIQKIAAGKEIIEKLKMLK